VPDKESSTGETVDPNKKLDFETQYEALNGCLADLESGRLSLDDSLSAYRKGIELVHRCRAILEQAQARVELIEDVDSQGVLKTAQLNLEVESHEALRTRKKKGDVIDEPF